jgi:hypothetical protein
MANLTKWFSDMGIFIFLQSNYLTKIFMMTKTPKKKADPVVLANLSSGNEELVLKTVNSLRSSGSVNYLPHLAEILINTNSDEVRKTVISLLGELKDKASVEVLMEMIEDNHFLPVRKELITSCWQNGLDFSPYLSRFVDWVIETDMEIAFEAFTVIENLDYLPEASIRETEIAKINRALHDADKLKTYLLTELRGILA